MRIIAKLVVLAALLALKPACGGGGGGGGGGGTGVSMPALPALNASVPLTAVGLGVTYPALVPETGTLHILDATPGVLSDSALALAIQALMNGGGRISLTTTASVPRTVVLTTPFHVDFGSLKIIVDGNGLITFDGNLVTRMFDMQYQTSLTVQGLKFVHGRAARSGGAIDANDPVNLLTVIDCSFDDCQTREGGPDRGGGAIRAWNTEHTQISGCTFNKCAASNGGAVNSLGSRLTIINSVFTQNAAFGTGGGGSGNGGIGGAVYVDNVSNSTTPGMIFEMVYSGCIFNANVANTEGGAIFGYMNPAFPASAFKVDACTFAGNVQVNNGSGGGAIYTLNGVGTLSNSTFNDNTSASNSGALRIDNVTGTVTNCTFTGNTAQIGGAIGHFSGTLTLQSVTVANNTSALFAAGLFQSGGTATVNKSIFADNTAPDLFNGWHTNTSVAGGGNLQWPSITGATGIPITTSGTVLGDPKLNALADNTGPTWTRSLGVGSAAIDAAPASGPTVDQRGVARDVNPDAGAYED